MSAAAGSVLANCAYCGEQPERLAGSNRLWPWFQVRCRNALCVEHGTVRHLTQGKADRLWNLRQAQQRYVLKNAAYVATKQEGK